MKMSILCTLLAVLLCSCTNSSQKVNDAAWKDEIKFTTGDTYPIDTDTTLDYWILLPTNVGAYASSMNEIPLKTYLEEATGVKINFIHPPVGQEMESFNLMLASMELPDIIERNWLTYPGGAQKAIDENVIIPLNDFMDKLSPNFKKTLEENPTIAKQASTDDGTYFCYPFMTDGDKLATYEGFIIRKDLLDKAGLKEPETIEEWDHVLRTFKEMGVKTPLGLRFGEGEYRLVSPFTGCFGFVSDFYIKDGKMSYGPYEPAFQDYVKQLHTWYEDGILDRDFNDFGKRQGAMVVNGELGATFCTAGGDLGKWLPVIEKNNPDIKYEPIKYMTDKKGQRAPVGQKNQPIMNVNCAITTQCKDKEAAMRFLDFGYSEEGHMLYNFGKEGVSYNMIDGEPVYTPEVLDPSKNGGLSVGQAMSKYMRACYNGPFMQDVRYSKQYMQRQEQRDALEKWSDTDMLKYAVPYLSMTEEENSRYNKIMQDVKTYEMEMLYKLIAGTENVEDMSVYYETMKSMGIEEAIEIKQAAYERYMKK